MKLNRNWLIATIVVPFWLFYFFKGGENDGWVTYLGAIPGFVVSDNSYIRAAEDCDWSLASDAYYVLEQRGRAGAENAALRDIHSDHHILWQYAAVYMASQGDERAIPYLIKLIRHTNQYSLDRRIEYLRNLSGQDFGESFTAWRDWYESQSDSINMDWESNLGYNPKVQRPLDTDGG